MILHGQNLVNKLRELCDNAKKRIWIVSPFIGSWNEVQKVIGINWITNDLINVRLLTDVRNEKLLDNQTFKKFQHKAIIKTLKGLHAKIYICDDNFIVTSANLTGTAFSRRYEAGILDDVKNIDVVGLFNLWWNKAESVDTSWLPKNRLRVGRDDSLIHSTGLTKLNNLPDINEKIRVFKDYDTSLKAYNHLKTCYLKQVNNKQIIKGLPVMLEIDAFLNYLFHEHPGKPTKKYYSHPYRNLTDNKRKSELKKYMIKYIEWLRKNPDYEEYRKETVKLIRNKLSTQNIDNLTRKDINKIVNSLHCMNSFDLNKSMFLNPKNNTTSKIRKSWKNLLQNQTLPIEIRMEKCNSELSYFGKSSIQEIIAWYYPEKYPLINTNSSSGLKFFGYNVKTY